MNKDQTRTWNAWLIRSALAVLCASCVDLGDPEPGPEDEAGEGGFRTASSSTTLSACTWETATGTTDITVTCDSGDKPIHGACQTNGGGGGIITDNHPWEASDASNQPEDAEIWYNTSSDAGWRCAFANTSGTNVAMALCCG